MGLIRIVANGIELDIVKETLTITKENNALSNDFKVSYSNFPFLIVENIKTIRALGSRDITSRSKPKIIPVVVEELGEKYYGELQMLSYLKGFRKVTLKYATELLTIMDKPLAEFMPVVSVIPGETDPVPFTEESETVVPGHEHWAGYPETFLDQVFPAVKYQFPTMYWKNKFGIDLEPDDEWLNYQQHINLYDDEIDFIINSYIIDENIIIVDHRNVVSPQVFLLSPLFYALDSLGWKMQGDFTTSEFVKRALLLSTKTNICETTLYPAEDTVTLLVPTGSWFSSTVSSIFGNYTTKHFLSAYSFPTDGKYILTWSFKITNLTNDDAYKIKTKVSVHGTTEHYMLFQTKTKEANKIFTGSCEFTGVAGEGIIVRFEDLHQNAPVEYSLKILNADYKRQFYEFHPTIELGRYVPEWDFGTYLNALKNEFNLRVDIDDVKKILSLNFNEESIVNGKNEPLRKSLRIEAHDQPKFNAFKLKYANDKDTSLWITSAGPVVFDNQLSDFVEPIESLFKFVPNNGYTAELSEDLEDKDGVGLMIYDEANKPYIANNYLDQTLKMEGPKGIYDMYWQKWLRVRLNASHVEVTGYFTETELKRITKGLRVYLDNQAYLVESVEYSETAQANFEVLIKMESINF